jgi:hypothetical protein
METYYNESIESLKTRYNDLFERMEVIRRNASGEDLENNARYQRLSRELARLAIVVHRVQEQRSPEPRALS